MGGTDHLSMNITQTQEACMEIYTWSRLRHDNVLPLLGFCFDFSTVSLISPWMANGSANDFLHANPEFPSVILVSFKQQKELHDRIK